MPQNFFDQFDEQQAPKAAPGAPPPVTGNFFDQFDEQPASTAAQPVQPAAPGERKQISPREFAEILFPGPTSLIRGVTGGAQTFVGGVEQLAGDVLRDPELRTRGDERVARGDEVVAGARSPFTAEAAQLVTETLPSATLPGGPGGNLATRVAGGVAADVASSVADPIREGQTRAGNLQNVAIGSAGLRVAGGFASGIANRFSNAAAGNFADPRIADLVRNADANEVSLFLDDATQAPFAQKASVAAEVFGIFGTAPGRIRQNDEALAAATRWLQTYAADNDEFAEIVQEGLTRKLRVFQRAASKKYAAVARRIEAAVGSQNFRVKTDNFDQAIDTAIAAETAKGGRANQQVVGILNNYRNSPRGNFEDMIEFRSDFNKDIQNLYRGDQAPNKTAQDAINQVREALDRDMDAFAESVGAQRLWRDANDFYQRTVAQFKKGKLRQLTRPDAAGNFDAQAAWRYLTQNSTNPRRAQRMWQALDAQGRAAVRRGLLEEAVEAATREGAPFSPARFAGELEKRGPVVNLFFRGRSGEEIQGLIRVMRHIERAGQFAENPPTGQRLTQLLLAGGLAVEPGTVIAGTGAALGIRGLFQTRQGRNLLLAANRVTPGSERFDEIIGLIERSVARSLAETREGQQQSQQEPR